MLEQIIFTKDRDNQVLADKNYRQSCVLARLNQEKNEDAKRIKHLTDRIEAKVKGILKLVETQSLDSTAIAEQISGIDDFIHEFAEEFFSSAGGVLAQAAD